MIQKRAVAGSIVALLVAVTSMAASCDLSCAFGFADSDCHASALPAPDSGTSAMNMSGMDMAGMAMPGTTDGSNPSPGVSREMAAHPAIGDMGPCERQSCERSSFVATKTVRAGGARVALVLPVAHDASACAVSQILHGARDDVAHSAMPQAVSLTLVLRI